MTNPPAPGNWGPQPPYGQGQWPPPQGWGPPPVPPKSNSLKWLLIGVAVLLVVAISVGATLLFTRDDGGSEQTATGSPPAPGEIASATDTGPVSIITEDPTCVSARPIFDTLTAEQRRGWTERDYRVPSVSWTSEQRDTYFAAGDAMLRASDQLAVIAKLTPYRAMRDLYTQAIVYWQAYVETFDDYNERDNYLALAASNAASAIITLCTAIDYNAAAARSPIVEPAHEPTSDPTQDDLEVRDQLISSAGNPICVRWIETTDNFDAATKIWRDSDLGVPASEWLPEQRKLVEGVKPQMLAHANEVESLGRESGNRALEDIATLSALYWRAFVAAIPSYNSADSYLSATATHADYLILNACEAAKSN